MANRTDRQETIRTIIRENRVRTQQELGELLESFGFRCTQATVSRDVQELGLVKDMQGCYVPSAELRMQRLVNDLVEDAQQTGVLVVVHTFGGSAGTLAAAFDSAKYSGLLGTVAGDDTIFIAFDSVQHAEEMAERIRMIAQR